MEQEVGRWLFTQLGYNASADATLSSNCRGNLKGLWEFIIAKYKAADSKRHIQHVIARHRREQEAALRAPQEQREAEERRQRLRQLQKKNAELEQTLASLQTRTESRAQEAADQACEQSLAQHVLQDSQAQTLLLQAYVHRGQQLLPQLQALLSQLCTALEGIKARCCRNTTGSAEAQQQGLLQQLDAISSSIKDGLEQALQYTVEQYGIPTDVDSLQLPQLDQHSSAADAACSQHADAAEAVQHLLRLCRLLQAYRLPADLTSPVLQLLQHPPSLVWDSCAQLAHQNLQDLTAQLDDAERDMLAPLHWPAGAGSAANNNTGSSDGRYQALDWKPDQQQQVVAAGGYNDAISTRGSKSSSSSSKHKLPWASGLASSSYSEAALQQAGISLPPELRVKMRLKAHMALHVQTERARQRARAAQQELEGLLGSTPILQAALLQGGSSSDAAALSGSGGEAAAAGGLAGWEAELAQLFLAVAQERAQIGLLQQYEQSFSQELSGLLEVKERTEEKVLQVRRQMADDYDLNHLLHLMAQDTLQLEQALKAHQQRALQLLSLQLLPCGAAAADAAQAALGRQQQEVQAAGKLPLLDLTAPQRLGAAATAAGAAGAGVAGAAPAGTHSSAEANNNPVLARATVLRLQAAGRQLLLTGRATTGPKLLRGAAAAGEHGTAATAAAAAALGGHDVLLSAAGGIDGSSSSSSRRFGDTAAVAALKGAAVLDPVAPLRCPAALLLDIAEQCKEARQLQQELQVLSSTSNAVAASSNAAASQQEQLQAQVSQLHQRERQEVVPQLQALLEEGQAAQAFTRGQLMTDLQQLWEMPAMHLAPHRTYQGKNCGQWLQEVQHLHAQKRELTGGNSSSSSQHTARREV